MDVIVNCCTVGIILCVQSRVSPFPEVSTSREIFPNLIVLPFFLVFSVSDLIFSILLCCSDKLGWSFSIFSTN